MNAALSKLPGFAAFILSALRVLPCASLSSGGGFAAPCAFAASDRAGGCAATVFCLRPTSARTAANFGDAEAGGRRTGAAVSTGARCTSTSALAGAATDDCGAVASRAGAAGEAETTAPEAVAVVARCAGTPGPERGLGERWATGFAGRAAFRRWATSADTARLPAEAWRRWATARLSGAVLRDPGASAARDSSATGAGARRWTESRSGLRCSAGAFTRCPYSAGVSSSSSTSSDWRCTYVCAVSSSPSS